MAEIMAQGYPQREPDRATCDRPGSSARVAIGDHPRHRRDL